MTCQLKVEFQLCNSIFFNDMPFINPFRIHWFSILSCSYFFRYFIKDIAEGGELTEIDGSNVSGVANNSQIGELGQSNENERPNVTVVDDDAACNNDMSIEGKIIYVRSFKKMFKH